MFYKNFRLDFLFWFFFDDNFELIIQVNGKVRGKEKIKKTLTEEEIKSIALSNENVSKHIQLDNIKKVIYVKEKLINFVI